jgi:hypothetical protein
MSPVFSDPSPVTLDDFELSLAAHAEDQLRHECQCDEKDMREFRIWKNMPQNPEKDRATLQRLKQGPPSAPPTV